MAKIPQEGGGGAGYLIKNFYLGSLSWVHFVWNIKLESVSADVRTDSILNKVHSFLEKDLLMILKGKFTVLLKCIFYRAYSMVGVIIHLMCVKSLQLACD